MLHLEIYHIFGIKPLKSYIWKIFPNLHALLGNITGISNHNFENIHLECISQFTCFTWG